MAVVKRRAPENVAPVAKPDGPAPWNSAESTRGRIVGQAERQAKRLVGRAQQIVGQADQLVERGQEADERAQDPGSAGQAAAAYVRRTSSSWARMGPEPGNRPGR